MPSDSFDSPKYPQEPCCCGCGQLTQRRFYPGCDGRLYPQLRRAIAMGDGSAAFVYRFVFKNNRRPTFPLQRRLLRQWLESQEDALPIAAD